MEVLYGHRHRENPNEHISEGIRACPNCPFIYPQGTEAAVASLLKGEDPDFSLPGHTGVQAENQIAAAGTSNKTFLISFLAAIAIAYILNYYLSSERS